MKTQLMILSVLALSASACGQKVSEANLPQPVKAAFMKQYPKADHTSWGMESKTEYEAEFKLGSVAMSATYSTAGQWIETEKDIKEAALPQAVRNTLAGKYAGYKVKGASHLDNPKGTFYEADIEKDEMSKEIVFNADGTVFKETVEENGKESDEND